MEQDIDIRQATPRQSRLVSPQIYPHKKNVRIKDGQPDWLQNKSKQERL